MLRKNLNIQIMFVILICVLFLTQNITSVLAAESTITYTYDDNGRLVEVDYGNSDIATYTYDDAGNPLSYIVIMRWNVYLPLVIK